MICPLLTYADMKTAMAELAGKTVDGKAVSEAVKKRLG